MRFKLVGFVPGVWPFVRLYGCIYLKGTAFLFFLTATPEVDCPSAGAGKRKTSQPGVKSPHTMMPLVLGFWLGDHTWERLGKFTNVIPSLSSFFFFKT